MNDESEETVRVPGPRLYHVPAQAKVLLREVEAAELLSISERKLWELSDAGEIPFVRIGKAKRYRLASLEAWAARIEALQNRTDRDTVNTVDEELG